MTDEQLLANVKELAPDVKFGELHADHGRYLVAECTRNGKRVAVSRELTDDADEDAIRTEVLHCCLQAVRGLGA